MPRKVRVGFQLGPLNSSSNRLHAYYLLLYTRYLLVPDAGVAYEARFQVSTRARPRKGAQTHRGKREREREGTKSGKFLHARSISSRNLYASFVGSERVGELTALQPGGRGRKERNM